MKEYYHWKRRKNQCLEETEQARREKDRGQAGAWADEAPEASEAATQPGRAEAAFAPNAVKDYHTRLELLVIKESARSVAL